MCYKIIRCITIQDDKVFLNSTSCDSERASFQEQEHPALTEAYQKGGLHAVLFDLGKQAFQGSIIFRPQNCSLTEYLQLASSMIQPPLSLFLDVERAGEFIAVVAEGLYSNPMYSYVEEWSHLERLRSDPESTLEICKKNPRAFNFSESNVRRDRTLATRYILQCASHPCFVFPSYFVDDIELAMAALRLDGRIFCQLGKSLRNNKHVAHFAYCSVPDRTFHATNTAHLGKELLLNSNFLVSLCVCCPDLEVDQTPFILQDPKVVKAWLAHNKTSLDQLHLLPRESLQNDDVVSTLYSLVTHDKVLLCKVARLVFRATTPEESTYSDLALPHLDEN